MGRGGEGVREGISMGKGTGEGEGWAVREGFGRLRGRAQNGGARLWGQKYVENSYF